VNGAIVGRREALDLPIAISALPEDASVAFAVRLKRARARPFADHTGKRFLPPKGESPHRRARGEIGKSRC
jgi:hypothetical protein